MDPKHLFMDKRLTGMCVHCGARPNTRDHVPSKVLLDEPYPAELPVVEACERCNNDFSLDEEYLSCFLECVICGTVDSSEIRRQKVRRILNEDPKLKRRIESSQRRDDAGNSVWLPEIDRVQKIVLKLARCHAAYELYPKLEDPVEVSFVPLPALSEQERMSFEHLRLWKLDFLPELGSRAFIRALGGKPDPFACLDDWIVVQPGRYRYAVIETGGMLVRMVLSEYLACMVSWDQ